MFAAAALFDAEKTVATTYAQFGPANVNKLGFQLESEIAKNHNSSASNAFPQKSIPNSFSKLDWASEYVRRERQALLNMTTAELDSLFADDHEMRKIIKINVAAIRRSRTKF
jgi:hypothetical protein